MENYTITKEQVLKLANKAEQGCTSVIESDLKNWFPDAFKTELTIGKWYKHSEEAGLFYLTEITDSACHGYGFRKSGIWFSTSKNDRSAYCAVNNFHFKYLVEATPEEIEASLISEAKKRGYKEGVTITWKNKPKLIYTLGDDEFDYLKSKNVLVFGNYGIFERGEWAKILPQEKTVVPMEKALKIIAKKMKVSPEDIEIKN